MDLDTFKQILEENRELLDEALYARIQGEIASNSLDKETIGFIVQEIEKAKGRLADVEDMAARGAAAYQKGSEKMGQLEQKLMSNYKTAIKKEETSQQDEDIKEAEDLISNL